jgi:hypothetical protein
VDGRREDERNDVSMPLAAGTFMTKSSFKQPAFWLTGCVLVAGLLLLPFAIGRTGSASPIGIAIAGAVCLAATLVSDAVGRWFSRPESALSGLAIGFNIRILPPLAICMILGLSGESGPQHMAFIGYLLVFYLVTLAVETVLNIRRLSTGKPRSPSTA